jgi:UDP-N-acetylmuramate: L-alanyl-gamma-D-glutamyl-meso-diaminopimelate ligase
MAKHFDLDKISKLYFVGIGGIAMSATASLAKLRGFEVLGSDSGVYEPSLSVLKSQDIHFFQTYDAANVSNSGAEVFVLSSGEDESNPEVAWLLEHGKKIASFPEVLAQLAGDNIRLVVGGTHGKSTTSSWLGHILKNIEDASFMVGAVLTQYNSNFYNGQGNYFVFEGDEYKSLYDDPTPKMKYYKADILILNNLELDHPDMYASLDELKAEFADCIASLPDDGLVIYNADSAELAQTVYPEGKRSFSFGVENKADIQLKTYELKDGETFLTIENKLNPENVKEETYKIALPGQHNVYNALAVITTLRALGFQPELIEKHLLSFQGIKRRFEKVYDSNDFVVIDDYAHHPTAIRETLRAAKESYPGRKIWAVFEPHTYSRTEVLLPELSESFEFADRVILAPIYSAREKSKNHSVTSEQVLEQVSLHSPSTRLVKDLTEALQLLDTEIEPGDVVVIMSVGSFNRLAYELKDLLEKRIV